MFVASTSGVLQTVHLRFTPCFVSIALFCTLIILVSEVL